MLLMLGQECVRLLISCLYIDTAWNHPCQWNRSCYWLQDSGLCPRGEEVSKLKNNQLNKCDFWRFHSVFCQILLCSSYNKSASLSCVCFIWNVLFSCKWKHNLADDIYFKGLIGSYSLVQNWNIGSIMGSEAWSKGMDRECSFTFWTEDFSGLGYPCDLIRFLWRIASTHLCFWV